MRTGQIFVTIYLNNNRPVNQQVALAIFLSY